MPRYRDTRALITLWVGCAITALMIVFHLVSKHWTHHLSFMFVGVPGPIIALGIGFALSRLSPRKTPAELADLTLWTMKPESTIDPNAAIDPELAGAARN